MARPKIAGRQTGDAGTRLPGKRGRPPGSSEHAEKQVRGGRFGQRGRNHHTGRFPRPCDGDTHQSGIQGKKSRGDNEKKPPYCSPPSGCWQPSRRHGPNTTTRGSRPLRCGGNPSATIRCRWSFRTDSGNRPTARSSTWTPSGAASATDIPCLRSKHPS